MKTFAAAARPLLMEENRVEPRARELTGCLLVFTAALCYYLSTAVIRWAGPHVSLDPAFYSFTRFLLGFVLVQVVLIAKRRRVQAKRYDLLIGRAVFNAAAVYCFYTAVQSTSLAEANILNMTYPVFVVLFSWLLLREQRDLPMSLGAVAAFGGIWLVLGRDNMTFGWGHLWGLASGIFGAWAMLFLNLSRRCHDTETVLFYLFGLGAILTYVAFPAAIFWPDREQFVYLLMSSMLAICGQYCITFGYRYVTAVEGGIISSSRILIAGTLGTWIAGDPALSVRGWLGAGLIFGVNVLLTLRKARRPGKFQSHGGKENGMYPQEHKTR